MAFITHVSTAVPRHVVTQAAAAVVVAQSLGLAPDRAEALRDLFEHSGVLQRHSVLSPDALGKRRGLSQSMRLYREHAVQLALTVARKCLADAELDARAIDMVVTSSCTGVLLPSLAALLVEELGLRSDVRRLPITEMGCAGGASALAGAHEFLRAFPQAKALVLAVELPTLTLQHEDVSGGNLVASAIFGDGAAAALVEGRASRGIEISATHTHILPQSLDAIGFDLRDGGLHVVLTKDVPRLIAEHVPGVIREFLSRCELSTEQLGFFALHPGGRKVLEALEQALPIAPEKTQVSWDVLRDYGNQSSVSVLFVLRETLARGQPRGHGLLAAFGPGITVELSLLRGQAC